MKASKYIVAAALALSVSGLSAQKDSDGEIIFKALTVEMNRSLTGLKLGKYQSPFFIANYLSDGKAFRAKASLGALVSSDESPLRGPSYRMMLGDYSLTDENFSGNTYGYSSGGASLSLPKENDYVAIRSAFWSILDRSYKQTVETYNQKLATLKQLNNTEKEPLDDYTRTAPVTLLMPVTPLKYDKKQWEKSVKEISAIFCNYPDIQTSSAEVRLVNTVVYLVNSEGTKIRYNGNLAALEVNISTQAEDGEVLRDKISYYAPLNEQLPSLDIICKEVDAMAKSMCERCKAPLIDEPYQGPVVFEGSALADVFANKLFGWGGLLTARIPVSAAGNQNNGSNKMESKLGKRICAENISIVSKPLTREYNNIPLIGAFEIDAEGVAPKNDLALVDKGILKTLLSDRVPTPKVKESNGHSRFSIYGGYQKSPGVIHVSYAGGQTYPEFIRSVAAETAKNGLDYYYIIRKLEGDNKPLAIYRVSVKTGEEKMVRSANITDFPMLSLKYALGGTSEEYVCNTLRWQSMGVSYIVPRAMAFNDISIEKDNSPKSKLPLVPNPLASK